MLLITTKGVLEDQYCSVPTPKQKLNPWELGKQFCKPSCCSGPLKTPPEGSCLAVLWEGKRSAKFVNGLATFSSVLITATSFRLSGDLLSHSICPAVGSLHLWWGLSRGAAGNLEEVWSSLRSLGAQLPPSHDIWLPSTAERSQHLLHDSKFDVATLGLSSWMWGRAALVCPEHGRHMVYGSFLWHTDPCFREEETEAWGVEEAQLVSRPLWPGGDRDPAPSSESLSIAYQSINHSSVTLMNSLNPPEACRQKGLTHAPPCWVSFSPQLSGRSFIKKWEIPSWLLQYLLAIGTSCLSF